MSDPHWQMTHGERYAIEGLLCELKPDLALETGTAEGGSLRRLAAHSKEVHAFDIVPAVKDLESTIANATIHIGDSAETLPEVLESFTSSGRQVDFALIDGDHTSEGVRRDIAAVLASAACTRTVIVFHDTANEVVRAGLESIDLPNHPKVALCELDFVPGHLVVPDHPQYPHAAWNGLGLVVLDEEQGASGRAVGLDDRCSAALVIERARSAFEAERLGAERS